MSYVDHEIPILNLAGLILLKMVWWVIEPMKAVIDKLILLVRYLRIVKKLV